MKFLSTLNEWPHISRLTSLGNEADTSWPARFAPFSTLNTASTRVLCGSARFSELPGKLPDMAERTFLTEAIRCYRVEAYRACIVMTWNLAFDHLLRWILKEPNRLRDFNAAIPKRFPKKPPLAVETQDGFEGLKEAEVVEVCGAASLMSANIIRILREKLTKRNMAAHPTSVVVVRAQADDVVTDLVNNVLLALT